MWRKARKKPISIEFREPFVNAYTPKSCGSVTVAVPCEEIQTLEGKLVAFPNQHYVIRGTKGELYPIRKDIFDETYEVIDNGETR